MRDTGGSDSRGDIAAAFHKASDHVKAWGKAPLPGGKTLEETLTIGGIPFWNAVSPRLAFGPLSHALSRGYRPAGVGDFCRAYARKAKVAAFDAGIRFAARKCDRGIRHDSPSFLFLGFSPYIYRDTLQPVAERIAGRNDCSAEVLDDTYPPRCGMDDKQGPVRRSIWHYWDAGTAEIAHGMRRTLKEAANCAVAASGLPNIVASSGVRWKNVRHVFDWLFGAFLPRLVLQGAIAKRIVERHRPVLLISPDVNDPRTRLFCLAGRLSGIRTLEVQFGFYGRNDIEWRFFIADHLAVTGDSNLEIMLGNGIPRERMTVTGSPRYDRAIFRSPGPGSLAGHVPGIPDGKKTVLFASQPNSFGVFGDSEVRMDMMNALFRAAAEEEGVVLVVKPHPLENPAEWAYLAKGSRNIRIVDKRLDIRELIRRADAFVTFFSGTTFDALVMNKPAINLSFPGGCANNLFDGCGATFIAKNADDVSRLLHSIGNGVIEEEARRLAPARERFLRSWFHELDGQAAERIETIALEMAAIERIESAPRRGAQA